MQDQPNSNQTSSQKETTEPPQPPSGGGDHIVVTGNIGPGASIGRGSARSTNIAGNDLVINNGAVAPANQAQFTDLLSDLRELIVQAQEKGELDEMLARQAVEQLETAADMVKKDKKPDKPILVKKLEAVAEMIQAAVEVFTAGEGGIATILVKALPIAFLLVKLAARLF